LSDVDDSFDRSEAKVSLYVRVLLHEFICHLLHMGKSLRYLIGSVETSPHQQDFTDQGPVWYNHLNRSKKGLKVHGKFNTTSITRIDRNENVCFELDVDPVLLNVDLLNLGSDRILYLRDQLCDVIHQLQLHPIEFIEQDPRSCRCYTLHKFNSLLVIKLR